MEPMKLTASQIRTIDTINADKRSYKITLQIALNFHSNMHCSAVKKELEFWEELRTIHKLDDDKSWTLKNVENSVCVVEKEKDSNKIREF